MGFRLFKLGFVGCNGKRRLAWAWWAVRCLAAIGASSFALGCGEGDNQDVTEFYQVRSTDDVLAAATPEVPSAAEQTPIVFASDRAEEGVSDLYVMAPDGTGVRRVTRGGDFFLPAWSPEGDTIAFRVGGLNAEVGLVAPDGSPPVLLTQGEPPIHWRLPVHWSADGQKLAFASRATASEVTAWVMSRSGGQQRRLLPNITGSQDVATWSWANGSSIVYTEYKSERVEDLWLVGAADSSEPVNLTQGRVFAPSYPEWSPEGSRIAFIGFPRLANGSPEGFDRHGAGGFMPPDTELFVIDVESRELTRITDDAWNDDRVVWSPDGNSLLISSGRDGDSDVWLVPLDAPELARNLIDDADRPHNDSTPDWYRGPR